MNVFHKKQIGRYTAKQRLSVVCRVCIHVVLNWRQDKAKKQKFEFVRSYPWRGNAFAYLFAI